jgi:hypothetical protein
MNMNRQRVLLMPNSGFMDTIYTGAQLLPLMNVAALYQAGQLGMRVTQVGKVYQVVKCDSGPASVAAGDVSFWKDRANYIVTNKLADAPQGRNGVAGMFLTAVTPGYFCAVQIGGPGYVSIKTAGAPDQGMIAVANSGSSSDVVGIPAGTAPTYVVLGVFTGVLAAGKQPIELSIGSMAQNP